jgi:hypothetical protein
MAKPATLDLRRLNRATLTRQGLIRRMSGTPAEAIGSLAGLQAQHADQPYIALWSRLAGMSIGALQTAIDRRQVVRATVMRSTLHLLEASDVAVFDAAVIPFRTATWGSIARRAGFDLASVQRALVAFCEEPRTIDEMETYLETIAPDRELAKVVPGGVRHAVFRMASSGGGLVHVPPSGYWGEHGRNRYVAAHVWLGKRWRQMEPAAATVAAIERYLAAYGPASQADIAKWLGQPRVGVLRTAIEDLGDRIDHLKADDGRDLVDVKGGRRPDGDIDAPPRFLSRWDSVLISYADRDRILPSEHRAAVVKKNGDFLPTFLVDGFVAGLWAVEAKRGRATIRLTPFARLAAADRDGLEAEAARLVRFIEPEATAHDVVMA